MRRAEQRRSERGVPDEEHPRPDDRYAGLGERELVMAMRRDEEGAFVEFVARFHPLLLRQVQLARVASEDRDALVVEVLGDMAERLTYPGARVPRSIAAYLVTCVRHRAMNRHRDVARRQRLGDAALTELDTHHERTVLDLCSEASLRASRGASWEPPTVRPALTRLAAALDASLNEEERRIIAWLGQHVTHRQMAEWLGIGVAAMAKRVARLRRRLRAAAVAYVAACEGAERGELTRFLERATPEEGGEDQ